LVQEKTVEVDTLKGQIRDLTHHTDHAWSEVDFSKQKLQEALEQVRAKCVEVSAKEEAEKMVRGDLNASQQQLHDAQALLELMSEQSLSQQHDLDTLRAEVAQLQDNLSSARVDADGRFAEQAKSLAMKDADIAEKQREIDSLILDYDGRLRSHIASLEAKDEKIEVQDAELMDMQRTIDGLTSKLEEDTMQLATKDEELGARERELSEARLEVAEKGAAMERAEAAWSAQSAALRASREDAQRGSLEAGNRLSHIESELQQAQVLFVISLHLIFALLIGSHLNLLSTFQELVHEMQRKQGEQNAELEAMRGQCQRAHAEVESRDIELKSCIARLDCTQETFLNLKSQHGQVLEELQDLKVQREQVSIRVSEACSD
jgi:chromosome segregation ATPase